MKQKREFPSVTVTKKQEFSIRNGHPWVYEDELTQYPERVENGSLVDVFGQKGNYLGTGFWSGSSKIRIRILDHNANENSMKHSLHAGLAMPSAIAEMSWVMIFLPAA